MKLPLAHVRLPYLTLRRWLVQPLAWSLFFITPWVNAFRVDMLDQRIWFLGVSYSFAQHTIQWIPIGFYGGVLFIAITSLIFGRWFCGWTCPHNAMTEWTRPIRQLAGREALTPALKRIQRFKPQQFKLLQMLAPLVALVVTISLTFSLASFVLPPTWIIQQWLSGAPHIALVFGQGLFTLIGLFLLYCGHDFCRTCCPYGMGQSISAYVGNRWRPMEIAFAPPETTTGCQTCTACQQACPVDIDPRQPENLRVGQFDGCFNCGACIDACRHIQWLKGVSQQVKPGNGWLRFGWRTGR